jgi:hypothetical protein
MNNLLGQSYQGAVHQRLALQKDRWHVELPDQVASLERDVLKAVNPDAYASQHICFGLRSGIIGSS